MNNGGNGIENNNKAGTFTLLKSVSRFKAGGRGCANKVTTNKDGIGGGNQSGNGIQTKKKKKRRMEDGKLNPKTVEMLRKKTKFSK